MGSCFRDLARELGHPWAEYWDFLDCFVDLASAEGLRRLEEFLSMKDFSERTHEEAGENEASNRFRTPSPGTGNEDYFWFCFLSSDCCSYPVLIVLSAGVYVVRRRHSWILTSC